MLDWDVYCDLRSAVEGGIEFRFYERYFYLLVGLVHCRGRFGGDDRFGFKANA